MAILSLVLSMFIIITYIVLGMEIAGGMCDGSLRTVGADEMSQFSQFLTDCATCGQRTSKAYARKHAGQCKSCAEPNAPYHGPKCPQCGAPISAYKAAHHYVCESCYRVNDPVGYANEVRGLYDGPDY